MNLDQESRKQGSIATYDVVLAFIVALVFVILIIVGLTP